MILAIQGYPGRDFATPRELAERLQITHHACVGLIDRCEQLEFVSRRENPEDGRSVLIEVTPKGIQILEKLSEIHLEEISVCLRIFLIKLNERACRQNTDMRGTSSKHDYVKKPTRYE
ncbi:hypothetical protein GCM10020331_003000 [Ectobacillus funiculus]